MEAQIELIEAIDEQTLNEVEEVLVSVFVEG